METDGQRLKREVEGGCERAVEILEHKSCCCFGSNWHSESNPYTELNFAVFIVPTPGWTMKKEAAESRKLKLVNRSQLGMESNTSVLAIS
jgi:hypothetical protein